MEPTDADDEDTLQDAPIVVSPEDVATADDAIAGEKLRGARRKRRGARPKVSSGRELRRDAFRRSLEHNLDEKDPDLRELRAERPVVRGDCAGGCRPCPWVSCKYHLYLSVNPDSGAITINFPDKEPWDLEQTCALDVAESGGITLEEVGRLMNVTRERIRQVESHGLVMLRTGRANETLR